MSNKKCNICGSTNCHLFPNKSFKNTLWQCQKCGLIFVYPQPKFSQIKKIYNQQYFKNNNSHAIGYQDYLKDKPNIMKTFEKRFKQIEKLHSISGDSSLGRGWGPDWRPVFRRRPLSLPKGRTPEKTQSKTRILDLGCALGFFLEVAKSYGWKPYGVEISDYASAIAQKRFASKIFNSILKKTCFSNGFFDIITMWDYLEHIPDPAKELYQVRQLLKKDGLLVLSTPNTNSLTHKIFKDRWMGYKDQEHLYYFSEKNIRVLLEKTGFQILKSKTIGKYVSFSLFVKRLRLYNKFLANILNLLMSQTGLDNFSFYVNPLDIICVYAQK